MCAILGSRERLLYEWRNVFIQPWTEETLIGDDLFRIIGIMKYTYTIYHITFKTKLRLIVLFEDL